MLTRLNLVPAPHVVKGEADAKGNYPTKAFFPAIYREDAIFENAVFTLSDWLDKLFDIQTPAADFPESSTVTFVLRSGLKPGAYRLDSTGECVTLYASDAQGAHHAVATLIQLIKETEEGIFLPIVSIEDEPGAEFSTVMLDLARVWHDFDLVLKYVDLCAFYKIKVLHLHFTDDQSYTLPSRLYPKLSTPGRFYSFEQIEDLNAYAKRRGVQLMPEIDVPGHCISFQSNYPKLFGTDKVIAQTEASIAAMKALFCELCQLFPDSHYIHIGGDEAVLENWMKKEAYNPYYEKLGIDLDSSDKEYQQEVLLATFVNEMATAVFDCGKQPVAWEGFKKCVNDLVRKDLIMVAWETYYQTADELLEAGFKIYNISWEPMYICTPRTYWPIRQLFNWNIYTWIPIHYGSPYYKSKLELPEDPRILGGGLCAWSDQIERCYGEDQIPQGVVDEFEYVRERVPALAENTWHPGKEHFRPYDPFIHAATASGVRLRKLVK